MIVPPRPPDTADVAAHYDHLDRFYRDLWGEHVHHGLWRMGYESPRTAARLLAEHAAAAARLRPGDTACDVGSGYGATARLIARRYGAQVTAITLSGRQHIYAVAQPFSGGPPPHYRYGDFFKLELPEGAFDAVLAIESLSHLDDKPGFFDRAARLLKPGGRLVVCAWLTAEAPRPWMVRYLLIPICQEGELPGLASERDVRRWIAAADLQLTQFEDMSRQVRRTWSACLRPLIYRLLTRPDYLSYLLDATEHHRIFALTLLRIWIAYRVGAFRYGFFVAEKPTSAP